MRMRVALSLLGLSLSAIMMGCASNGGGDKTSADMPLAEPVPILERYQGSQAQDMEIQRRMLIQTAEQFEQLGAGTLDEVEVDWDTQDLVVLAMGMRPTGGYWCTITAAQVQGETLYVQGVVNRPGSDSMTTQAQTYPWCAAVIPNVSVQEVRWDLMNVEGKSPGDL